MTQLLLHIKWGYHMAPNPHFMVPIERGYRVEGSRASETGTWQVATGRYLRFRG